jgi:hypothetical protein
MKRMKRVGRGRRIAALAVALGAVFVSIWAAVGFPDGIVFAIAVGVAVAIAVFSDSQGRCPSQRDGST